MAISAWSLLSWCQTKDKVGQFRMPIKSANKNLSSVMQKSAEFVCHQNRFCCPSRTRSILDEKIAQLPRMSSCDWPTVCLHDKPVISDPRRPRSWYMQLHAEIRWPVNFKNKCTTSKLLRLSNQRRTNTVRFLCCFAVNIANNIEACAYLSSAILLSSLSWRQNDVCHGSTITSADFLRQLNHAHKSWPTLSIVWPLL